MKFLCYLCNKNRTCFILNSNTSKNIQEFCYVSLYTHLHTHAHTLSYNYNITKGEYVVVLLYKIYVFFYKISQFKNN